MKSIKALLAVSVLAAAGTASAATATYDLLGTGVTRATAAGNIVIANQAYTGTGSAVITDGVLDSLTFNYSAHLTSPLDANVNSTLTGTFAFSDTSGNFIDTITGCTNQGTNNACATSLTMLNVPQSITATASNFSNLLSLSWTTVANGTSVLGPVQTTVNFTAAQTSFTPDPTPEVPVPAAAWLFGSGLLGLAGTARRRKTA